MTPAAAVGELRDGVLRLDAGQPAVGVETGPVALIAAVVQALLLKRLRTELRIEKRPAVPQQAGRPSRRHHHFLAGVQDGAGHRRLRQFLVGDQQTPAHANDEHGPAAVARLGQQITARQQIVLDRQVGLRGDRHRPVGMFEVDDLADEVAGQHAVDVGVCQHDGSGVRGGVEARRQLQTAAHLQCRIDADAGMASQVAELDAIDVARPEAGGDRSVEGPAARLSLVEGRAQARRTEKADKQERRRAVPRQGRDHLSGGRCRQECRGEDQAGESEVHVEVRWRYESSILV